MRSNPKQEAVELYNEIYETAFKPNNVLIRTEQCKQITLIAVEYLIANEHLETGDQSWWKQVKQELKNL